MRKTIQYYFEVLKRVLADIKFLSERGLAFRGHEEKWDSPNNGNFMGAIELIAEFDPFLYEHLEKCKNEKVHAPYLSKPVYEELIVIMGKHVQGEIVNQINNLDTKYNSIIVDSTPDLTHVDQLVIVVRYCYNGKTFSPLEEVVRYSSAKESTIIPSELPVCNQQQHHQCSASGELTELCAVCWAGGGRTSRDTRANPNGRGTRHETLEKAREIFQLCDKEEKGFITKRDMQRLQNELPLTPEQLEAVFDSLDQHNNGYLTPAEFSMGFGQFLGIEVSPATERLESSKLEETFESGWSDDLDIIDDEEEKRFCVMMQHLGASQIFEDQYEVRELWTRLRRDKPELLANFEQFLSKVSTHIQEVQHDKETMEQALKRKECDHDREVRYLYEEMEQQIKKEKEKLLSQTHACLYVLQALLRWVDVTSVV
ncbi:hypothetical protein scyTo_0009660 [Scyliorhinus torazame]|uniref:EF-hand domain-containing protein n=1 Tax=Scyliorhinus torazame TaxID=75743 RepID=A0A401NR61_SCYTO|nr:hypothetical protein [Scyliorhinus torazame]